jgi:hypothetical protein
MKVDFQNWTVNVVQFSLWTMNTPSAISSNPHNSLNEGLYRSLKIQSIMIWILTFIKPNIRKIIIHEIP